jgi:hypothetical protein
MAPRDEPNSADPEEGPVLGPDELDITDDDHVTEIDDARYVVSPEERPADEQIGPHERTDGADRSGESPPQTLDRPAVRAWLAEDLEETDSRYGFDMTATFDDAVRHRRMVSNDVVTIFESLVLWYAQQIDGETPVEEVLGILLWESNVPVRYPARSLGRLVESTGLDTSDSIGDLLATVDAEEGVKL